MRLRQPHAIPADTALRLAGLLAVLTGLLAMHGLGGHGASRVGMEVASPEGMTASAMAPAVSGLDAITTGVLSAAAAPVIAGAESALEVASDPAPSGMGMNMAALCVTVLGVALIVLLLRVLRRRRVDRLLWTLPREVRAILVRGRPLGPPSLTDLSIQRC